MATFNVTNTMDAGNGSLRDAIAMANATPDADTITFDSSLTGMTIGLTSGELSITNPLTINGLGANLLTVDAQQNGFRVFNIDNGNNDLIDVFIDGLTITGGNPIGGGGGIFTSENLTVQDSIISGNTSTGIEGQYDIGRSIDGGGINSYGGYLKIVNTDIINNEVKGQLADGNPEFQNDFGDDPDGGGVSIRNGQLNVVDSTISGNKVTGGLSDGGGIYGWYSDITVTNSTISGNTLEGTALGSGGGIYNRHGNTTIANSTIANNSTLMTSEFGSADGGGIFSRNGDLEITNSTVSGNSAVGLDRTDGGGVYSKNGNLTVANSTISYNSTAGNSADGGGIFSSSGIATITNSTIYGNSADGRGGGLFSEGRTNLTNTIIANSTGRDAVLKTSKIDTNVNNLIEDGHYNPFLSGDPGLGPLQNNGGSTETHALLSDSIAIDAGDNGGATGLTFDQRGQEFDRIVNGTVDIGAYEVQEPQPPAPEPQPPAPEPQPPAPEPQPPTPEPQPPTPEPQPPTPEPQPPAPEPQPPTPEPQPPTPEPQPPAPEPQPPTPEPQPPTPEPQPPTPEPQPPTPEPQPPTPETESLLFSLKNNQTLGGVSFRREDIVEYNLTDQSFSKFFDGSDVGLKGFRIDAFEVIDDNEILFSFERPKNINGIQVDDSDIVKFTPTSSGDNSSGSFELYFDGSDVGLTEGGEDIDGLSVDPLTKDLLISTRGSFNVSGISGKDEDILRFNPDTGAWSIEFDGSDVDLTGHSEDIDAIGINGEQLLLSTTGSFSVTDVSGQDEDVFIFNPNTLGISTSGTFEEFFSELNSSDISGVHFLA
ncbi:right-handed parallel beta-helix repeat-containing protein [Okeania sp. SIO1F9]|nr:right-handed parallel beta-helix repeat-containing protein [Okeania sp. SIO1F9]